MSHSKALSHRDVIVQAEQDAAQIFLRATQNPDFEIPSIPLSLLVDDYVMEANFGEMEIGVTSKGLTGNDAIYVAHLHECLASRLRTFLGPHPVGDAPMSREALSLMSSLLKIDQPALAARLGIDAHWALEPELA